MLMDTLPLSAATAGLKLSWASASAAAASAAAAVLPLCGLPAGVAVLLISAETALSAVAKLTFPEVWKLLVDEGYAASVPEAIEVADKTCIDEEVKASTLRASAPEWKPSTPPTEVPTSQSPVEVPWDAHLEDPSTSAVQVRAEMKPQERRRMLKLMGPAAESFMNDKEFISLGCYCATAYALQLLDLRQKSYPFDWTRSPLEGISHSINSGFSDFLTYTFYRETDQHRVFLGASWGGSFWHHNLDDPAANQNMRRRASRFMGQGDVPAATARVFVRLTNDTSELDQAWQLRQQLKMALPNAAEIYLLILVELQEDHGPIVVTSPEGDGVMVYTFTSEDYQETPEAGRNPLAPTGGRYCAAIAAAIRIWTGENIAVRTCNSFAELSAHIWPYHGGDPAFHLFAPRWLLPPEPPLPHLLGSKNSDQFHFGSCW